MDLKFLSQYSEEELPSVPYTKMLMPTPFSQSTWSCGFPDTLAAQLTVLSLAGGVSATLAL